MDAARAALGGVVFTVLAFAWFVGEGGAIDVFAQHRVQDGSLVAHGLTGPGSESQAPFRGFMQSFGTSHDGASTVDRSLGGPTGYPQALAQSPLTLLCDELRRDDDVVDSA